MPLQYSSIYWYWTYWRLHSRDWKDLHERKRFEHKKKCFYSFIPCRPTKSTHLFEIVDCSFRRWSYIWNGRYLLTLCIGNASKTLQIWTNLKIKVNECNIYAQQFKKSQCFTWMRQYYYLAYNCSFCYQNCSLILPFPNVGAKW